MQEMRETLAALYDEGSATEYTTIYSYLPYPISSHDYLRFAEIDLAAIGSLHSKVNAIGNIKRAIDSRVDSILDFWALRKKNQIIDFPDKLSMLEKAGITTPQLVRKINAYRNGIEHSYGIPNIDKIIDYKDTAQLFLGYTDRYLREEPAGRIDNEECHCDAGEDECKYGTNYDIVEFELDRKKREIRINYTKSDSSKDVRNFIVQYKDEDNYLFLINLWYKSLQK